MLAAGLLARNARAEGADRQAVGQDHARAGLARRHRLLREGRPDVRPRALGFYLAGYGCTTCIGNSGPLPEPIAAAVEEGKLVVRAVLSGNRNFEGRVNPHTRFNYLASPPLVVAYALAGTHGHRPRQGAARHRHRRAGVPARHLAGAAGDRGHDPVERRRASMFTTQYAQRVRGRPSSGARSTCPTGDTYAWDAAVDVRRQPAVLRRA